MDAFARVESLAQPSSDHNRRSSSPESTSSTYAITPTHEADFFRTAHGRKLNSMNPAYMLPADTEELKRLEIEHRLVRFLLDGKNYVGPMPYVLAPTPSIQRRVLDCGTGGGLWAIEMADEFPHVLVTGVDLAPIQPREVPPNCFFELFDLDGQRLPYPDAWFDVVHARSIYYGMRNYPQFIREVARVLRPGGMVILVESDSTAITEGKRPIAPGPRGGAPGWFAFWDHYRRALTNQGVDVTIPTNLCSFLSDTRSFLDIVAQEAVIPIGFWPKDPVLLTIGQLAWMNYDSLIPALKPLLLSNGLSESATKTIITEAQRDLYFPVVRPSSCIHFVHARRA